MITKKSYTALLILLLLNGISGLTSGDSETGNDLASTILSGQSGASALALAVIRDGKLADLQYAGVLGNSARDNVDRRTLFRACSLSKPVFTYLVLRLVDEGLIDLDRSLVGAIAAPLTDFSDYQDVAFDPRMGRLTARLILSHQSGLPNWRWQRPDGKLAFEFDPGSSFSYSGEGYRFLQTVIERLSGRDLDDLCRQYVFGPLGMGDSRFLLVGKSVERLSFDIEAIPPHFREQMEQERNAAGSLLTTVIDYARFLEAVIGQHGLSTKTAATMLEPAVKMTRRSLFGPGAREERKGHDRSELSWCLGWIFCRGPLGEAYFHVGAEEGFENFAVFFPRQRAGLVVLSSGPDPSGLVREAVTNLFGETGIPFDWMGYGRSLLD